MNDPLRDRLDNVRIFIPTYPPEGVRSGNSLKSLCLRNLIYYSVLEFFNDSNASTSAISFVLPEAFLLQIRSSIEGI